MKQSLGIAKQVRLLEAIDRKLNVLLEDKLGKATAAKLIAELEVPVNPQRQRLDIPKTDDAVGALPVEDQQALDQQAEQLRTTGTVEAPKAEAVKPAEVKEAAPTKTAISGGATSVSYQQAQQLKAGRGKNG